MFRHRSFTFSTTSRLDWFITLDFLTFLFNHLFLQIRKLHQEYQHFHLLTRDSFLRTKSFTSSTLIAPLFACLKPTHFYVSSKPNSNYTTLQKLPGPNRRRIASSTPVHWSNLKYHDRIPFPNKSPPLCRFFLHRNKSKTSISKRKCGL